MAKENSRGKRAAEEIPKEEMLEGQRICHMR
jgi:hypothetical protein